MYQNVCCYRQYCKEHSFTCLSVLMWKSISSADAEKLSCWVRGYAYLYSFNWNVKMLSSFPEPLYISISSVFLNLTNTWYYQKFTFHIYRLPEWKQWHLIAFFSILNYWSMYSSLLSFLCYFIIQWTCVNWHSNPGTSMLLVLCIFFFLSNPVILHLPSEMYHVLKWNLCFHSLSYFF